MKRIEITGFQVCLTLHCKKVSDFPVPSGDVTYQTLPGEE